MEVLYLLVVNKFKFPFCRSIGKNQLGDLNLKPEKTIRLKYYKHILFPMNYYHDMKILKSD